MNGYLIDTNVISKLRKGQRSNTGVRCWIAQHAEQDLWLSVLVVAELRCVVAIIRRRDPDSAQHLEMSMAILMSSVVAMGGPRWWPTKVLAFRLWCDLLWCGG